MKYKVIVLDFDGTIVESVGIKDKAIKDLFKDYPQALPEIMKYHLANNAVIRYEKFKYITENILKQPYSGELEKDLCGRFSRYVVERITACPYVEGAVDFLDCFYGSVPMYLASVNPSDELQRIIEARGLAKYFKKIYANPWDKAEAIKDIIRREGAPKEDIVFISDTMEDYNTAVSLGIFFIGRDSKKPFGPADIPVCADFRQIKRVVLAG